MEIVDYQIEESFDDFQEGFNSGYLLAKYEPKLLEQILFEAEQNESPNLSALIWGKKEFENELKRQHLNEFEKFRNKGRVIEKERDR